MSDVVHTIVSADDLPPDACHWPACADPICERNEAGTCPLDGKTIVECRCCGAATAIGMPCRVCDTIREPEAESHFPEDEIQAESMGLHLAPPARRSNDRRVVIVDDDATVVRTSSLRALLEVAGDMRTLAEALGVSPSTISRALAEAPQEQQGRDARIRAVQQLVRGER